MEKPAFLGKIKNIISDLKDKVVSWVKENTRLAMIIGGLFSIMLICIILLIIVAGNKKEPEKNYEEKLKLSQDLIIPPGPELPRDYTISRETKENWTDEDAEKWFTVPSDEEIEGLSKANNNMIDDILGAAP